MQDVTTLIKVNVVPTKTACFVVQGECIFKFSPNHFKFCEDKELPWSKITKQYNLMHRNFTGNWEASFILPSSLLIFGSVG